MRVSAGKIMVCINGIDFFECLLVADRVFNPFSLHFITQMNSRKKIPRIYKTGDKMNTLSLYFMLFRAVWYVKFHFLKAELIHPQPQYIWLWYRQ